MKRASLVPPLGVALALGGVCLFARADDVLPQPPAANRYAAMADRSPFAPPTIGPAIQPVAAPPPGPKWSDELTVTLLTQQGGVYFATIVDKSKNNERFLLQSNREDLDRHLALASVQWGDLVDQTTVTLRHNNEFAPVRFDANATAAPALTQPRRPPLPGTYPAAAGTPPPGRFQPPPAPPVAPNGAPNVARRQSLIRSTPTVAAPGPTPPNMVRRPLSNPDEEDTR